MHKQRFFWIKMKLFSRTISIYHGSFFEVSFHQVLLQLNNLYLRDTIFIPISNYLSFLEHFF